MPRSDNRAGFRRTKALVSYRAWPERAEV